MYFSIRPASPSTSASTYDSDIISQFVVVFTAFQNKFKKYLYNTAIAALITYAIIANRYLSFPSNGPKRNTHSKTRICTRYNSYDILEKK